MQKKYHTALIDMFSTLNLVLNWLIFLRSAVAKCVGAHEELRDGTRTAVNFLRDAVFTDQDDADAHARKAVSVLLSGTADAETVGHMLRKLRDFGFPEPCLDLTAAYLKATDTQGDWAQISNGLNFVQDTLSAHLVQTVQDLQRANMLEAAYDALHQKLLSSGNSSEDAQHFVVRCRKMYASLCKK